MIGIRRLKNFKGDSLFGIGWAMNFIGRPLIEIRYLMNFIVPPGTGEKQAARDKDYCCAGLGWEYVFLILKFRLTPFFSPTCL